VDRPLMCFLGEGPPPDRHVVGGKAAALDRLARIGEPVPGGFCVTADAYRAHLGDHGLLARFAQLRSGEIDEGHRRELEQCFDAAPISGRVGAALAEAVARLRAAELAVRSSASDEDAEQASFAGAHDSFLKVRPDGVEAAVRGCWRSLWSERALAYRRHRGLGLPTAMPVIVMPMVEAVVSAVAFSRHPVLETSDVLVSCTAGLGDALMAGGGSAVTYDVERCSGDVLDVEADDDAAPLPLPDAVIGELGRRVAALELVLGFPVDVEAVHDGERWLLVQARPITTAVRRA